MELDVSELSVNESTSDLSLSLYAFESGNSLK